MKLTAHPLAEALPRERTNDGNGNGNGCAGADASPPCDAALVLRLRVSLALLLTKGDRLSTTFYRLLFERSPALRSLFPADMANQHRKITQMLVWIVTHLDRREQVLPAVRDLGRRHAGYGAAAEHYPVVRDALIDAMAKTAGNQWNANLAEDWRVSLDLIACHMLSAASAAASAAAASAAASGTCPFSAPATSTAPR